MKFHSYIDVIKYKNTEYNSILCLDGWCFCEEDEKIDYFVRLDDELFPVSVKKSNRKDALQKNSIDRDNSDVGFYLKVDLTNKVWNTIEVLVKASSEEYIIFRKKKASLDKIADIYPFEYNIDNFTKSDDKCVVFGWAFTNIKEEIKLSILDNGNKIKSNTEWSFREDVAEKYSLDKDKMTCGFVLRFEGDPMKEYQIQFELGNKKYCVPLTNRKKLHVLLKEYIVNFNGDNVKKACHYLKQNGVKKFINRLSLGTGPKQMTYQEWFNYNAPSEETLNQQRTYEFLYHPKISVIVATYNTPLNFLREMIDAVFDQTYSNWELCIADGSTNDEVKKYVKDNYLDDSRIKYIKLEENLGIAGNMNAALKLADGEYIGLYDHDDLLTPDALFEIVSVLNRNKYDIVYSDEDKYLTDKKELVDPHFKPDFNIDLMRSVNYICHFFVVSSSLVSKVGDFDKDYDGAQDYDFMLRCIENTSPNKIYHVAKILYHWRMHSLSTASNPESKLYAFEAGKRAIQAHLNRLGIIADVSMHDYLGLYRVKYKVKGNPLISILIPNKDHIDDLDKCLQSIFDINTYQNYEVIIIENNSTEKNTFEYYENISKVNDKVKVVYWKGEFNYSAINNFGAEHAKGDYLLLLNNDTKIINSDCIEEMLSYCQREEVGIVGAKLCYSDDTIQHAGVIVGLGGIAGHSFVGKPKNEPGYFGRAIVSQDLSAVTAACLMVKTMIFKEVGGLTEELKVAFNDIDFCMKVRKLGYLVVYNPFAQLYHYESKSRGTEDSPEKVKRFNGEIQTFRNRWPEILENGDPYYNPNLEYMGEAFSLRKTS